MVTHHPFHRVSVGSRGNSSAPMSPDSSCILFALKTCNICCCMCVDTTDARLFSTCSSKIALGSAYPCASLSQGTLQRSGRLPNKQMKSTEREGCFLASSETWLRQSQTPTLDTAWQPTVVERRRGAHMITRQIMFVSGDSEVMALERQNGGVDLTVQSCCSPQIIVACFYRGVAVSSFHLPCGWFNLWDEPWPQGQNPIT